MAAYPGENGKIAFVRGTNSANDDIYTINPDGTGATPLTPPDHLDRAPSWSPAGDRIAFHRLHTNGDAHPDVYTMNADGTAPTNLTPNTGIRDAWPTWSPDASRIAFVSTRHPPLGGCGGQFADRHDLYVMNQDGSGPIRVTTNRDQESKLSWSPRGDEIALRYGRFTYGADCDVISQQQGGYTVDAVTGGMVRNTLIDDWSPDGSTYVSSRQELTPMTDIWVGETNVTNTPDVGEIDPAWSPDGRQIVFSTGDLWVMDADGSNRRQLTATPGVAEYEPDWQPAHTPSTYVRPLGAGRVQVSLVPAYEPCVAPNREHGAPLVHGSCAPPQTASTHLTMQPADHTRFTGSVRLGISLGAPGGVDDTDVNIRVRLADVMRAFDSSEYTGELRASVGVRLTDKQNVGGTSVAQTAIDFPLELDVPCTPTADPDRKALCLLTTSLDTLIPGAVPEGSRAMWALDQAKVFDGGADEQAATEGDNKLFAVQGVFVP